MEKAVQTHHVERSMQRRSLTVSQEQEPWWERRRPQRTREEGPKSRRGPGTFGETGVGDLQGFYKSVSAISNRLKVNIVVFFNFKQIWAKPCPKLNWKPGNRVMKIGHHPEEDKVTVDVQVC